MLDKTKLERLEAKMASMEEHFVTIISNQEKIMQYFKNDLEAQIEQ